MTCGADAVNAEKGLIGAVVERLVWLGRVAEDEILDGIDELSVREG